MLRKLSILTLMVLALAALSPAFATVATYNDYGAVVDNQVFADLGAYIFSILVAAVVAGLGLLVARVGVKRIWIFIKNFF